MSMHDELITEYVELCEQLTAIELIDQQLAAQAQYARLDEIWYVEMTEEEQTEAADRLVAKARAWHDARRTEDP